MEESGGVGRMKGYKVFNPDWTCREFQYEVGKTYELDADPKCCERGFHFCEKAADCFRYYSFSSENKVAEVVAIGKVDTIGNKSCTNKIQVVREIPWQELLTIVNTGENCTGLGNTGDCNTGNWNTGNRNTGNRNTGDWNTGNRNTGNRNTGDWNTGNRNTGNRNTGDWNTGNRNTGNRNTGDWNTGNRNTGNRNTGDWNTGDWNTGNWNTGDWNAGDWNTGDWNKSSFNTGCFNTEEHTIMMFNKPSDMTYGDWLASDAKHLLNKMPVNVVDWVAEGYMTDEEKTENPTYKTTGGYLKVLEESEIAQLWWDELSDEQKEIIKGIPNFDAEIFKQCTGIDVNNIKE